ncbi:MAG: T9SS type A sorting domain-containing protein, partial [candidate division Zixibacteria bacterium]|nr:T9SS type A sorting domain-containing protein [candidate division Zixibacteria bacterium]
DYDQIYSCIDKTAEGWLPPPDNAFRNDLADGYDTRYLFFFGPFELLSQDTLHFAIALIAGDSFHIYTNNPIDPSKPDSFYNKLNFTNLVQNALSADSLYHDHLITDVEEPKDSKTFLPDKFSLSQNYPNPFNPNTLIEYALPQPSSVKLIIHNILGQKIRVMVNEYQPAGYKRILWDGRNEQGQMVKSGICFYQLKVGERVLSKKMLLLK